MRFNFPVSRVKPLDKKYTQEKQNKEKPIRLTIDELGKLNNVLAQRLIVQMVFAVPIKKVILKSEHGLIRDQEYKLWTKGGFINVDLNLYFEMLKKLYKEQIQKEVEKT